MRSLHRESIVTKNPCIVSSIRYSPFQINSMFIVLFYSLYLVFLAFHNVSFTLESFVGRSVSSATSEGLDIGKRMSTFYKGVGLFVLLVSIISFIIFRIRKWLGPEEFRILNTTSFAGAFLLFFHLIGGDLHPALHLIIAIQFACIIGCAGKIYFRYQTDENNYITLFSLLL